MSLELRSIRLEFDDGDASVIALDDINLSVAAGEFVVLTGPSGSGKSSLLAVAGLLVQPTGGQVVIDGVDVTAMSRRARTDVRRDRLAFVFQTSGLFPSLTALEQLELVCHMRGSLDDDARRRARELLTTVGLGHRLDHRPASLSGGERQRVALARALMTQPAVLLLDEPTAALDQNRSREMMDLIGEAAYGLRTAALLVTHDLENLDLADRHVTMSDGRLVAATEPPRPDNS